VTFRLFERQGVSLRYRDTGEGRAVLFQHGLGGDEAQVANIFPENAARRITLECRGQGGSSFGPAGGESIARFACDVEQLADELGITEPVLGGISMGAAIALRLAVRSALRPSGLVLARPAWIAASAPPNMAAYGIVGDLIQHMPMGQAREQFAESDVAIRLSHEAPDNLASLLGFFDRPEPQRFGRLLSAIAQDGPGVSEEEIAALRLPTLIIGHGIDHVHPLGYAQHLAHLIASARLVEITPKAKDPAAYAADFRSALLSFLGELS
jgi:pimeloyl-ACP methyl ester carboxylesterase